MGDDGREVEVLGRPVHLHQIATSKPISKDPNIEAATFRTNYYTKAASSQAPKFDHRAKSAQF